MILPKYPANAVNPKQEDLRFVGEVSMIIHLSAAQAARMKKRPKRRRAVTASGVDLDKWKKYSTIATAPTKIVPRKMRRMKVLLRSKHLLKRTPKGVEKRSQTPM